MTECVGESRRERFTCDNPRRQRRLRAFELDRGRPPMECSGGWQEVASANDDLPGSTFPLCDLAARRTGPLRGLVGLESSPAFGPRLSTFGSSHWPGVQALAAAQ